MKRKLLGFLSLFCALLFILTGCASDVKTENIKSFLSADARFTPSTSTAETVELLSILSGQNFISAEGPYLYFTYGNNDHTVFNAETGKVALSLREDEVTNYDLEIHATETDDPIYYFEVTATTINGAKTFLYNENGEKFAETDDALTPSVSHDIVRLDGKCYVPNASGSFVYACDYSDAMELPYFSYRNDIYYYEYKQNGVSVYNKSLSLVSTYTVPSYADANQPIILANGDVLIQYVYTEQDDAKDYTYMLDSSYSSSGVKKYTLKTVIVNAETGKAKETDLDYLLNAYDAVYMDEAIAAETGLQADSVHALVRAYLIENERVKLTVSPNALLVVKRDGSIAHLEQINGETVQDIRLVSDGRFRVDCTENSYLINRQGTVLGRLSSESDLIRFGDKTYLDGKVFGPDLTLLYDLEKNGYTFDSVLGNGILMRNKSGNLFVYDGEKAPTMICRTTNGERRVHTGNNFIVVEYSDMAVYCNIFNDRGQSLRTFFLTKYTPGESFETAIDFLYEEGGITIFSTVDEDGVITFYRIL